MIQQLMDDVTEIKKSAPGVMTARVLLRDVYGVTRIYPNDENARQFARIAGTKTISEQVLKIMRALGFQVFFDAQKTEGF